MDEAAQHHEQAEAAMIWLAPSAASLWDESRSNGMVGRAEEDELLPYAVPLKGGRSFDTYAAAPFADQDVRAAREGLMRKTLATFDQGALAKTIDVRIKRQNTERFLQFGFERGLPTG